MMKIFFFITLLTTGFQAFENKDDLKDLYTEANNQAKKGSENYYNLIKDLMVLKYGDLTWARVQSTFEFELKYGTSK